MIEHPLVVKLNRFILGKPEQSGSIAELNVSGFDFPTKLDTLFESIILKQSLPPLVILTGNAGDGKSHLIFKIWLYLTQCFPFQPLQEGRLPSLHQLQKTQLEEALSTFQRSFSRPRADAVVEVEDYLLIKDASAVDPTELKELLIQAFQRLLEESDERAKVAIVSINEGVLRSQLRGIEEEYPDFSTLTQEIINNLEESKGFFTPAESQIKVGSFRPDTSSRHSALVLNLNTRDLGAELLNNILSELAQTRTFVGVDSPCAACPAVTRCPIRFNMLTLGNTEHPARQRIAMLFEVLNYIGHHITLREALSTLAYALTSNLTCATVQHAIEECDVIEQQVLPLPIFTDYDPPLSRAEERYLLRLIPYVFFNTLFAQSIRQEEIDKLSQLVPVEALIPPLNEERVLFNLGLLDPAGFASPSHDVETSFTTASFSAWQENFSIKSAPDPLVGDSALSVDSAIFEVLRTVGQRMSTKGIPDARLLRTLVIITKRHTFFFSPDTTTALRHSMFFFYEEFNHLINILKKKTRSHEDKSAISRAIHTIVEALNQFQQPRTVGKGIRDYLEMVQREHLVLYKRIATTEFDLVPATPRPNAYVEQTQVRIRILHKPSHTTLDCDLFLYELLLRFVSGSLSYGGLEPRMTDIENFLTRLRGAAIQRNEADTYTLVDRSVSFSVGDGQIIVRPTK